MSVTLRAVLLDMDGLLLDTEKVSKWAWQHAAKEHGFTLNDEHYFSLIGRNSAHLEVLIADIFGESFPYEVVRARRYQLIDAKFDLEGVPVKPGSLEVLSWAKSKGIPVAVCTSTRKLRALKLLSEAALLHLVSVVVGGDEVANGKPAPDIYLQGASILNVLPSECAAFEDSEVGLASAIAAKTITFFIPDLKDGGINCKANYVLPNLTEALPHLNKLFS
jgi:HAD superfamily hydrolase (TIGR01509 family)